MTSAADLLGADISTVGRSLGAGFAWWVGELADMVPAPVRALANSRPSLTAERGPDGGYILTRAGRVVMAAPGSSARRTPVTLLLPRDSVLTREVTTPAVSDRDARRLLTLDIDRLTPFSPAAVHLDIAFLGAAADDAGRRRVAIAVVSRQTLDLALEQARAAGFDPRAVSVAGLIDDHPTFDFLPQARAAGGAGQSGRSRLYAWGAVAFLLLANLAVFIGRDIAQVRALQNTVEEQRGSRDLTLRLRRQVQAEAARRALVAEGHGRGEPLRVIDAVTRALPDGAWVQRLSWNGKAVRLAGYRGDNIDIIGALRASPLLANVRNSTGDPLARMAAGQPFDVTADLTGSDAR